jgi:hypothetical protein
MQGVYSQPPIMPSQTRVLYVALFPGASQSAVRGHYPRYVSLCRTVGVDHSRRITNPNTTEQTNSIGNATCQKSNKEPPAPGTNS